MGKNSKRQGGNLDLDEIAAGDSHESGPVPHNSNGSHGGIVSENGRGNPRADRNNGGNLEDQVPQTDPALGTYLDALEELRSQMALGQKAMKNVYDLYGRHKRDIQDAVRTRQRLHDMTRKCKELETTIKTLQNLGKERDKELAKKLADIEMKRNELETAVEDAEESKKQWEDKKEKFDERLKLSEIEQQKKLSEHKADLEKKLNEQYKRRVDKLERETRERQDGERERMVDLESKNKELKKELEEQKNKLKQVESRCKDAEMLKTVYEADAEKLRVELKLAENEFGLNVGTDQSYKEKFLKNENDIAELSLRYFKELSVGDLNAIHDKIKEADEEFTSVPISSSETSEKLRIAHARRVIAAQLEQIIWQPFSSEITFQDPKYDSLFTQISEGLMEYYGKSGGPRAERLCTALCMRGLQSRPPALSSLTSKSSTPSRAEIFADKVMAVLSILVKPSLHPNLRNNLLELATSAISVWNVAQTDKRKFVTYPILDPEDFDGWSADISAPNNEVTVLFPRIIAQSCSRVAGTQPVGPPGGWIDSEPESYIQETCIHGGTGLAKWSALVLEGEEEDDERREQEDMKKREEKKRELEESLKRLENPVMGHRRKGSQSKRDSITESRSSPTAEWVKGAGQRISEGAD